MSDLESIRQRAYEPRDDSAEPPCATCGHPWPAHRGLDEECWWALDDDRSFCPCAVYQHPDADPPLTVLAAMAYARAMATVRQMDIEAKAAQT